MFHRCNNASMVMAELIDHRNGIFSTLEYFAMPFGVENLEWFGVARWLSGRASDLRSSSRWFEARPRRCCVTTLGKLFTPYCLCHQAV